MSSSLNAPERYDLFTLKDGEQKLTVEEDTKIPNACTVRINKEDHTLANMLRAQLLHLPQVIFAGYKVEHPLEPHFDLKVQTDGSVTPLQAVREAVKGLIVMLDRMRTSLQGELLVARHL